MKLILHEAGDELYLIELKTRKYEKPYKCHNCSINIMKGDYYSYNITSRPLCMVCYKKSEWKEDEK